MTPDLYWSACGVTKKDLTLGSGQVRPAQLAAVLHRQRHLHSDQADKPNESYQEHSTHRTWLLGEVMILSMVLLNLGFVYLCCSCRYEAMPFNPYYLKSLERCNDLLPLLTAGSLALPPASVLPLLIPSPFIDHNFVPSSLHLVLASLALCIARVRAGFLTLLCEILRVTLCWQVLAAAFYGDAKHQRPDGGTLV